ncbi:MAG: methyltransferase domain-containing protein [Nanoarchaeota archaeon]|nr:methyltransferase domain-containing protein [Nanoarchaeota archaeon]
MGLKKLNLGCGNYKLKGYINVDINPLFKPDTIIDLNNIESYKQFESNEYDEIYMSHILEHLSDPFSLMKEFHRILKPKGILKIKVPHFSRGFTHSQHKSGFDVGFPLYFNKKFKAGYFGFDFKLIKMKLNWMIQFDLKKSFTNVLSLSILKIMNHFFNFLAYLNPYFCSRFWCYFVGGFEEIEFILKKTS